MTFSDAGFLGILRVKGLDTFGGCDALFFQGRQLTRLPVWFSACQVSSEKGPTLKGKKLLPRRAIVLILEQRHFQKEGK